MISRFREGEEEKAPVLGADGTGGGSIELSCVCGIVDFDETDLATIKKLGVPVKCCQCCCWLHPACMNIKQTTVEIHTDNGVKPTRKKVFLTPEKHVCPFCVVQKKVHLCFFLYQFYCSFCGEYTMKIKKFSLPENTSRLSQFLLENGFLDGV